MDTFRDHYSPGSARVDQRSAPSSAIRLLGEFTHGLRLADVPDEVRRQGALSLLDTIGCMVAGSATSDARALLAAEGALLAAAEVDGEGTARGRTARRRTTRSATTTCGPSSGRSGARRRGRRAAAAGGRRHRRGARPGAVVRVAAARRGELTARRARRADRAATATSPATATTWGSPVISTARATHGTGRPPPRSMITKGFILTKEIYRIGVIILRDHAAALAEGHRAEHRARP
jgi:hypothetical protein